MRSRAIVVATVMLLMGVASGCDSDASSEPKGRDASTAATSPASSPAPSTSPSGPAPATGPVAELGHLRYRLPEGSRLLTSGTMHAVGSFHVEHGIYDITGSEQSSDSTLDEAGEIELDTTSSTEEYASYEHTGNRTINGQEVWVIEAKRKDGRMYEITGVRGGFQFVVTFMWPASYRPGRDVVESVLATVEWK